jgi:hypothetical protein
VFEGVYYLENGGYTLPGQAVKAPTDNNIVMTSTAFQVIYQPAEFALVSGLPG